MIQLGLGIPVELRYRCVVDYLQAIKNWRALPEGEKLRRRWELLPRQVAASMAFEGEPVSLEWLTKIHAQMDRPAGLKPREEFSAIPK